MVGYDWLWLVMETAYPLGDRDGTVGFGINTSWVWLLHIGKTNRSSYSSKVLPARYCQETIPRCGALCQQVGRTSFDLLDAKAGETHTAHTHTQRLPFDNLFWVGGPTGLPTAFARGGQYPSMCIMQNDYCLMILNIDQFPIFDYYTQMSLMSYYVLLCSDPRYRRTRPTRRPA